MATCLAKFVQGSPKKYNDKKEPSSPRSPRLLSKQKENFNFTNKKLSPKNNEVKIFKDDKNTLKKKNSENESLKNKKEHKHSLKETLIKLAQKDKNSPNDPVEMLKNCQQIDKLCVSPSRKSSDRKSTDEAKRRLHKSHSPPSTASVITSKSVSKKSLPRVSPLPSGENSKLDEVNFTKKQSTLIRFAPINKIKKKTSSDSSHKIKTPSPSPPRQPPPTPEDTPHPPLPCFVRRRSTHEPRKASPEFQRKLTPKMHLRTSPLRPKCSCPQRKDSLSSFKSTSSKRPTDLTIEASHVGAEKLKRKNATFLEVDHLPLSAPRSTYVRESVDQWAGVRETFNVGMKFVSDNWREVFSDLLRWPGVVKLLVIFLSIAYGIYLAYGPSVATVWILCMWSFIFFLDHYCGDNN